MKRALLALFLSSAALSSAHADSDALTGRWRGTFNAGSSENVLELQFDESAGVYRGHLSTANTSFPVSESGHGQAVRIVVPNVGIFEGWIHGDILEGTFTGPTAIGSFRVDRAPEPD